MEREIYIEKIAQGYNISKEAIYAEVNKLIYNNTKEDKVLQSREIKPVRENIKNTTEIDEDLKRRENTIIAILLDSNANMFAKIKEQIKPEDFKDSVNRKIAEQLYKELDVCMADVEKLYKTKYPHWL